MRYYLDRIGFNLYQDVKDTKELKDQRKTYGFDERDIWDLDETMVALLYERLCMFRDNYYLEEELDTNLINLELEDDLSYIKVLVDKEERSLLDVINELIALSEYWLKDEYLYADGEYNKRSVEEEREISEKIWDTYKQIQHHLWS